MSRYDGQHGVAPMPLTPQQLKTRAGRICVALSGPAMLHDAERAVARERCFELRLDLLANPSDVLPTLHGFLGRHQDVTVIATCRRAAYGGAFRGTADEQVQVLESAAQGGCRLVDVEMETAEELGQSALNALRQAGAAVIVSWHDFSGTPDLDAVLQRIEQFKPDFVKIVPTAQTLRDALRVIDLLERYGGDGRLIAMSMGQKGVLTRVLGPRFGSAFTFAALDNSEGTAPGQIAVSALRDLYRAESITAGTELYGVAGAPIAASLSPLMHNTAFAATNTDAVYLPLETADAEELREAIERLHIRGLSITMPLKETMLPLIAHRDVSVERMGACNTLLRSSDGILAGFNTDMQGIISPLQSRMPLASKRVLVVGAGGAARAAVFGLRDAGAEIFLLNRTIARAEALARQAGARVIAREIASQTHFDVIINSTPYGMRGKDIEPPIEAEEINCDLFFDLVYNPVETPLIRLAARKGIAIIAGVEMFVAQGMHQFELWTGQPAPAEAMRRAVLGALAAHHD